MKYFHKTVTPPRTVFYEILIQKYVVIIPKFVENLKKNFIKAVRGGGVTSLWQYFIKFRYFLSDGFPEVSEMILFCDSFEIDILLTFITEMGKCMHVRGH